MKRTLSLLLAGLLTISLFGCDNRNSSVDTQPTTTASPTEPTQESTLPPTEESTPEIRLPEGTVLFGLDLSGKNLDQTTAALQEQISAYRLQLTVNNTGMDFSSEALSLALSSEQLGTWFTDTAAGKEADSTDLIQFDTSLLLSKIKSTLGRTAQNAAVRFQKSQSRFVITPHIDGRIVDTAEAEAAAISAIRTLSSTASAAAAISKVSASVKKDDPRIISALNEANSYLDIALSFSYRTKNGTLATEALDSATLASLLKIQADFSVIIDEAAVKSYVKKIAERHSSSRKAPFVTTYGTTIGYNVDYYSAVMEQAATCQDLISCLQNKKSGTCTATYYPAGCTRLPYGGNYVEVNLSEQRLWVYKNGEMVFSTPVVSGNVKTRKWTSPGVFTLYEKDTNCTLAGSNYISYVDYWMAFNGPIGLHDATWRTQFGGEVYQFNGSHGCVNLPHDAAGRIYDLVYVGMKVIVYGGATTVSAAPQEITGTSAYTVPLSTEPFQMDITFKYEDKEATYKSSNPNVVKVNNQGTVTVVGIGTATITVRSEAYGPSFTATVTVTDDPKPTEPAPTEPTEPTETTEPVETTVPAESEPSEAETSAPPESEPSPDTSESTSEGDPSV